MPREVIAAAQRRRPHRLHRRQGRRDAAARSARAATASPSACACATAARRYDIRLPLLGDYQAVQRAARRRSRHRDGRAGRPRAARAASASRASRAGSRSSAQVRGGLVVIDYAHKPDALAAALEALRPFAPGRLICVFGCGGDRDKGKRPIMGRIAAEHAPTSSSSPTTTRAARTRPPSAPRSWPARPARARSATGPRRSAPACACSAHGDVLLIAGKGHETGQIVGSTVLPFSDHDAVRAALAETPINA